MKKIVALLLILMLASSSAFAGSVDLSNLTPEELADIKQQLSALEDEQTSMPALDILYAMIEKGAPIDPEKLQDLDSTTDANGLLGTPGSYTSKTDFGCVGYAKDSQGYWVGGSLEIFENESDANSRFEYIAAVYNSLPALLNEHMFLRGKAVLRISEMLEDDEKASILSAFEAVVSGETKVYNELTTQEDIPEAPEITSETVPDLADTSEVVHTAAEYITLQNGSTGPEVAQMQSRLKELGYLSDIADGIFGNNTKNAVSAFQQANSLEVTGIASPEDQAVLFNGGVISASGSAFAAYDPFAVCPAEISRVDLKSSYGSPYVTYTITNVSSGTIQAINCKIRFFDAFGDRIVGYGEGYFEKNYSLNLTSGKSASISTIDDYEMFDYQDAAYVSVAVTRVLMADGTDLNYPEPVWFEGD